MRKIERPVTLDEVEEAKLPGSGTIRLSQIKTEFGGANNLKDYYGAASGIPNSGTIKLTDFYGKEKPPLVSRHMARMGEQQRAALRAWELTRDGWLPWEALDTAPLYHTETGRGI